ncbi:hypothetical protein PV327_006379 [Microctonus hyperodae]|uniref:Uncharacterized protein n=1 Tax=Microctonus hyperodae TaxID=165561 RepID=A0AA39F457_MICHY|nr:hypothetical protein PV327_006379 [Microctonus hyperodae]
MWLIIYYLLIIQKFFNIENINANLNHNQFNNLEKFLQYSDTFFVDLKSTFLLYPENATARHLIDIKVQEIEQDVIEKKNNLYFNNQPRINRRELNQENKLKQESNTLNNIDPLQKWNLINSLDVAYVNRQNIKNELISYVITINYSELLMQQLNDDGYTPVTSYSMENGKSFIVLENIGNNNNTLLIIEKVDGHIEILNLNYNPINDKPNIHHIQTISTLGVNHLGVWHGMNRLLYLGIITNHNDTIYSWSGQKFDLIQQIINFGGNKLFPLYTDENNNAMSFVIAGVDSRIFTFETKLNQFIVTQNFGQSHSILHLINIYNINNYNANFIALVEKKSIIIYKKQNVYVPYQKLDLIGEIEQAHSFMKNNMIFLFLVTKKSLRHRTIISTLKYNGWKFENINIKSIDYPIDDITLPFIQSGQWYFAMKVKNDTNIWQILQINDNQQSINLCDKIKMNIPTLTSLITSFNNTTSINLYNRINIILKKLSIIYENFFWQVNELKHLINMKMSIENITLININQTNVHVLSHVFTDDIKTQMNNEIIEKLTNYLNDKNEVKSNFELRKVTITSNTNLLCPIPAVNYKVIQVKGLINNIPSLKNTMNDLLRINYKNGVNNCQIINAVHIYDNVETIDINIPSLDIAHNLTHQNIYVNNSSLIVDELEMDSGGLFLPMNHSDAEYELFGTLSVSKAKLMEIIEINGHINGTGPINYLSPISHIQNPIILNNNSIYHFKNIKVWNKLIANDIIGLDKQKQSYNWLKFNTIPINSMNIPIHVKLQSNKIDWNNVYALESSRSWITIKNPGTFNVTGLKMIPAQIGLVFPVKKIDEIISTTLFENSICTAAAYTDDIYSLNITVDRASIKNLSVDNIITDSEINNVINKDLNFPNSIWDSIKNLTNHDNFQQKLKCNFTKWSHPGVLRGPIKVKKLSVSNVNVFRKGFYISLPSKIKKLIIKKNSFITKINNTNITDFMNNVINIYGEINTEKNITFVGDVDVDEIIAIKKLPLNFSNINKTNFNLGEKTIIGEVESQSIKISSVPSFTSFNNDNINDESIDLIIDGNVLFISPEPRIQVINNWRVENLLNKIWMKNQAETILKGKLFKFDRIIINNNEGVVEIKNSLNILDENKNKDSWNSFCNKIFSRSQIQKINNNFTFESIEVLNNIIGNAETRIISSSTINLYNLEHNTFQKCKNNFVIFNNWKLNTIYSSNLFGINGRINNLNLSQDVVRMDVEKNIITAKKIIDDLIVNNISEYSNFNELIRNAVMTNLTNPDDENITIDGKKIFTYLKIMDMKVEGKVSGKKIEECMQLNKNNGYFRGKKIIKGSLNSRNIIISDGYLINGINFMTLLNNQLKKKSKVIQSIINPIVFHRELKIIGNVTIAGRYQKVMMQTKDSQKYAFFLKLENLKYKFKRIFKVMNGEKIDDIILNNLIYWNKLEFINHSNKILNEIQLISNSSLSDNNELFFLENLGKCYINKILLICNDTEIVMDLSSVFNNSKIIKSQIVNIGDVFFLVVISSDPGGLIIYSYDPKFRKFNQHIKLDFPNIIQGSVKETLNLLWIALEFEDITIILRYDRLNEFQEFFLLPPLTHNSNNNHQLLKIPSSNIEKDDNEILFIRNDGIWRIGGLSAPKQIIKKHNLKIIDKAFLSNNTLYIQIINEKNNQTNLLKARYINH